MGDFSETPIQSLLVLQFCAGSREETIEIFNFEVNLLDFMGAMLEVY